MYRCFKITRLYRYIICPSIHPSVINSSICLFVRPFSIADVKLSIMVSYNIPYRQCFSGNVTIKWNISTNEHVWHTNVLTQLSWKGMILNHEFATKRFVLGINQHSKEYERHQNKISNERLFSSRAGFYFKTVKIQFHYP